MGFNMLDPVVGEACAERSTRIAAGNFNRHRSGRIHFDFRQWPRHRRARCALPPGIFGYENDEAGINRVVYDWVDGKPKRKALEAGKASCLPRPAIRMAATPALANRLLSISTATGGSEVATNPTA